MSVDKFFEEKIPKKTCQECKKNKHPVKYKQCWSCWNTHYNPNTKRKILRERISKSDYKAARSFEHREVIDGQPLLYYKPVAKDCLCFFLSLKGTEIISFRSDPRALLTWNSDKCSCDTFVVQGLILKEMQYLRELEIHYRLSTHVSMGHNFPFDDCSAIHGQTNDGFYDTIELMD